MPKTRVALLVLVLAFIASPAVFAQGPAEDPESLFYAGLDADTIPLDEARLEIAGELGPAVATEFVVALCAPPVADPDCQDSNGPTTSVAGKSAVIVSSPPLLSFSPIARYRLPCCGGSAVPVWD